MSTLYWRKSFFSCMNAGKKALIRSCPARGGRIIFPPMMQFCVLGSGSGGNATIVKTGDTVLLVDAGFSAARLRERMRYAGVEPDDLDAILLTHEHADHMKGVHQFTRKHAVRVYATRHTALCVQGKGSGSSLDLF